MLLFEIAHNLKLEEITPSETDMKDMYDCFEDSFGLDWTQLRSELTPSCKYWVLRDEEDKDKRIVGMYILDEQPLPKMKGVDMGKWKGKGVQGVVLALVKKYRSSGYGSKLKDLPEKLGYDYVWGLQLASLNNIDHWLKRREIVYKNDAIYVTAQRFK